MPFVFAVGPEIGVGREDLRAALFLGHADQAGIGKTHRQIAIAFHESKHPLQMVGQAEIDEKHPAKKKLAQPLGRSGNFVQ